MLNNILRRCSFEMLRPSKMTLRKPANVPRDLHVIERRGVGRIADIAYFPVKLAHFKPLDVACTRLQEDLQFINFCKGKQRLSVSLE